MGKLLFNKFLSGTAMLCTIIGPLLSKTGTRNHEITLTAVRKPFFFKRMLNFVQNLSAVSESQSRAVDCRIKDTLKPACFRYSWNYKKSNKMGENEKGTERTIPALDMSQLLPWYRKQLQIKHSESRSSTILWLPISLGQNRGRKSFLSTLPDKGVEDTFCYSNPKKWLVPFLSSVAQ